MTKLPLPLKNLLSDPSADLDMDGLWQRVADGRPVQDNLHRRPIATAVGSLIAAAIAAVLFFAPVEPEPVKSPPVLAIGARSVPLAHDFADGSRAIVLPDSDLLVLDDAPTAMILLLSRGSASFEVRPGGPRRWTIECGLATVEVIGTRFFVERSPRRLKVTVEEGAVLVRGERVPDRAQRLGPGQSLEVVESEAPAVPVAPAPVKQKPAAKARPIVAPPKTEPIEEPAPQIPAPPTPAELLAEVDAARLRGDFELAADLLETVLRDHSEDPSAAVAAYLLGRIYLENLDRPHLASSAFQRAMSLGLPLALQESAEAHLARARAKMQRR